MFLHDSNSGAMHSSVKKFQIQNQNCYILVKHWYTYCMAELVRDEKENLYYKQIKKSHCFSLYSPLQKREGTGVSFLYWLDWKSKH